MKHFFFRSDESPVEHDVKFISKRKSLHNAPKARNMQTYASLTFICLLLKRMKQAENGVSLFPWTMTHFFRSAHEKEQLQYSHIQLLKGNKKLQKIKIHIQYLWWYLVMLIDLVLFVLYVIGF